MDKKLKLAFFIDDLGCGGAEKSLVTLLSYIHPYYDISVYVVRRGGVLEKELPSSVKLLQIPIPKLPLISRLKKVLYVKAKYLLFREKINPVEAYWKYYGKYISNMDNAFDVAIAYQQGFPTYYVLERVRAQKKICWINADISALRYDPEFNAKVYEGYDSIVAVSEKLREMLLNDYQIMKGKLHVVNDIVPASLISKSAKEFIAGLDTPKLTLTTVGRLVPVKGYDLAISAAAILRDKGYDFKWYFVGDGVLRPQIEDKIHKLGLNDYIILTGSLSNPYPYIANADIYVQPSISEGFGIALSEAKILCRPIVSTDFEVVYNLIRDNENGLICRKNAMALAQAIERLINDVALRNRFSKALEKELAAKNEDAEWNRVIELIGITR